LEKKERIKTEKDNKGKGRGAIDRSLRLRGGRLKSGKGEKGEVERLPKR